VGKKYYL